MKEIKKNKNKKFTKYIITLAIIFTVTLCTIFILNKKFPSIRTKIFKTKNQIVSIFDKREKWITVFVHGSFNSSLGLLSFRKVLKDDLSGSEYSKMVKNLRKDKFFYQQQPILQRGLIKVVPSFNGFNKDKIKLAAYPIIAGYEEILNNVNPKKEKNDFFTFGWSGILSQNERRKESLRLYNVLCEKIEEYKNQGINPKIRILAHSHGGNVSLNLAAINEASNILKKNLDEKNQTKNIHKTIKYLKKLSSKKECQKNNGQKKFDYCPQNIDLKIDELILMGSPVQQETETLVYSDIFKQVYSLYSEQDVIQSMDVFSTKQRSSKQRFDLEKTHPNASRFFQAKIMIDRQLKDLAKKATGKESLWEKLFPKKSKDPTHKDLWLLAWSKQFSQPDFPLSPLPVVILVPLIVKIINENINLNDIDINLCFENKDKINFFVLEHNKSEIKSQSFLAKKLIDKIKKKTMRWKPNNLYRNTTYKKIRASVK
jgi:hypothetical protein